MLDMCAYVVNYLNVHHCLHIQILLTESLFWVYTLSKKTVQLMKRNWWHLLRSSYLSEYPLTKLLHLHDNDQRAANVPAIDTFEWYLTGVYVWRVTYGVNVQASTGELTGVRTFVDGNFFFHLAYATSWTNLACLFFFLTCKSSNACNSVTMLCN